MGGSIIEINVAKETLMREKMFSSWKFKISKDVKIWAKKPKEK